MPRLAPRSTAASAVALWALTASVPAVAAGAAARAAGAPVEESASERRAVRGSTLDDLGASETPELRALRRFEEQAFPRPGHLPPAAPPDDAPSSAPVPLPGRWEGTGDATPPPGARAADGVGAPTAPAAAAAAVAMPDSEWLRALKLPDLPVRWEPQVLRYLDYFKSDPKGRLVMGNWLRRAGRFREMFERVLDREGLPKDLVYVAMIESGFETSARSRVGAGGIWQFMPGAARAYGLEVSYWVDARRDPERGAEAAARYLKDLYARFGSWPLAFAAYNAGYGAVLKSITRYNTNDYWELCRHEAGLPWESSLYVPKILAAAIVGHNVEAFGFAEVVAEPPFAFDRVDVPGGTALAVVARAANTRPEVLQALNPHLVRERTPPDRATTPVRLPPGGGALFAEAFDRARAQAETADTVVLRFGESIDDVAKARGVPSRDLRRFNGVRDSSELRAGVAVLVPRGTTPAATDRPVGDGEPQIVAVPDRVFSYEGRDRVFYRTRDGDSLEEIADVFGVRSGDLIDWNNIDGGAKLHANMILQVYVSKDFNPANVLLLDPARVRVVTLGSEEFLELEAARRGKKRLFYVAKVGDTLVKVGRRYGLTPGDLARINRFSYNTDLQEGQRIVVYSPFGEMMRETTMGLTPDAKRPKGGAAAGAPSPSMGPRRAPEPARGAKAAATATAVSGSAAAAKAVVPAKGPAAKPTPSRLVPAKAGDAKAGDAKAGVEKAGVAPAGAAAGARAAVVAKPSAKTPSKSK